MDDSTVFLLIIGNIILSAIVAWAASQRGRDGGHWLVLSLFISPILALLMLMAVGDGEKKKKTNTDMGDYLTWKQSQSAPAVAFLPAINSGLPKPLLSKWHVARGEENLGEFSLTQITDLYRAGALTSSDLYWDTQAQQWLELAAHPRLG